MSQKIGSLERALDSKTTFERIDSILNNMGSINEIKTHYPEATTFIHDALNVSFSRLNISLALIAGGEIRIDDTSRELTTNKEFLLTLPSRHIFAVSYQDEQFWNAPEGADFLEAHRKAIALGRTIHRIFLLEKEAAIGQQATISKQMELGVACHIVVKENVGAAYHEDFVLYDNRFVRFARLENESVTAEHKVATLTSEPARVTHYVTKWEYLKSKSTPATDYYSGKSLAVQGAGKGIKDPSALS
jgi:hypothetical protein